MSNALVPLQPRERSAQSAYVNARPQADFVAHLIATREQAPQTRVRRREEPQAAIAAYAALGHWPTMPGGGLSRSL